LSVTTIRPNAPARSAPAPDADENVRLDGARSAERNLLTPQRIGQLVDSEAGTVGEQHPSQDRPLLPSTNGSGTP
jgi:hypothetical protein